MEPDLRQSIMFGAKRLLNSLPKLATGIIGLSGFAYIVGWAYAQAYFSTFGASWVQADLPILTLVGYSWWPLVIVLFFAYLGITDLAETERETILENSRRLKATVFVVNYGRWIFIALSIADLLIANLGYPTVARILSIVNVFVIVALATSTIELLVFRLGKPDVKISLHLVSLTYLIIAIGLYFAPTQMGRNAALQDKNYTTTSLPIVMLRDEPTSEYYLLISSGDRFYVFPSRYESKYPPIRMVNGFNIKLIQKR
jgi:hypothetical protein